jgi:hypothetical protein
MQDLYFVDVEQWREALGGMEAVALIPIICVLRYEYEVLVGMSGITGSDLYGELANAIRRVRIPVCVQPLTWTFGHIISAYNNFPELDNLYSFRDSIQPFSLGHGRRVLLSAMFLLLQGRAVDMKSWGMHIKRYCLAERRTSSIALAVMPLMSSSWNI